MAESIIALASIVRRVQVTSAQPDFRLTVPFTLTVKGPIVAAVGPRPRVPSRRHGHDRP